MSDITPREVESLIHQISCGGRIGSVENGTGKEIVLFFSHPMAMDLVMADHIRATTVFLAGEEGLPTEEEMVDLLIERGLWGHEEEEEIEKLTQQLEGQRVVLSKTTRVPANRERLKKVIKDLEDKIWAIRKVKEINLIHTKERKADEERMLFLTWAGSHKSNGGGTYWDTFEGFKDAQDWRFRTSVSIAYSIFSVGIPNDTVRYIARQSLWRMRFLAAQKNGGNLFSRDVSDYSVDMLNLMYWSNYYASIYEMMPDDRPDDDIIADDQALDAFMEDYFSEQKTKSDISKSKKNIKGKSAWDHGETIVTKGNPLYEDISYSETLADKLRRKGNTGIKDKALTSKDRGRTL